MELGGKSPNIVFADADLDLAVQGVATAIFQNAGQTCSAGSRLLVERKAHDALVERLVARARAMRDRARASAIPTWDRSSRSASSRRSRRYVAIGSEEGARVVAGGARPSDPSLRRRLLLSADAARRVTPDMRVAQEEIFGPVLAIIGFDERGGGGGAREPQRSTAWSPASGRATSTRRWRSRRASSAGQVYVNTYGAGGGVELPFGGYKKSGYGREKGLESLASYTQVKNVCVKYAILGAGCWVRCAGAASEPRPRR